MSSERLWGQEEKGNGWVEGDRTSEGHGSWNGEGLADVRVALELETHKPRGWSGGGEEGLESSLSHCCQEALPDLQDRGNRDFVFPSLPVSQGSHLLLQSVDRPPPPTSPS